MTVVTKSCSSGAAWSDSILVYPGKFNLSISGTSAWSATVQVQRRFGSTGIWRKITAYTTNAEEVGISEGSSVHYRAGIPTTMYVSGKVTVRLAQG